MCAVWWLPWGDPVVTGVAGGGRSNTLAARGGLSSSCQTVTAWFEQARNIRFAQKETGWGQWGVSLFISTLSGKCFWSWAHQTRSRGFRWAL